MKATKRQRLIINYIRQFNKKNGYSPSYREIMSELDYNSVATVAAHINNLIERGYVRKRPNAARSLEIVGEEDKIVLDRLNSLLSESNATDKQAVKQVIRLFKQ